MHNHLLFSQSPVTKGVNHINYQLFYIIQAEVHHLCYPQAELHHLCYPQAELHHLCYLQAEIHHLCYPQAEIHHLCYPQAEIHHLCYPKAEISKRPRGLTFTCRRCYYLWLSMRKPGILTFLFLFCFERMRFQQNWHALKEKYIMQKQIALPQTDVILSHFGKSDFSMK